MKLHSLSIDFLVSAGRPVYLSPIGLWFLTCQACGHVGLVWVDKAWDRKLRLNNQISRLLAHIICEDIHIKYKELINNLYEYGLE